MMGAFDQIANVENPSPAQLAGDINTALATTLFGLAVAIPTMAVHAYMKNRISTMVTDLGFLAGEMVERFRPIPEGV